MTAYAMRNNYVLQELDGVLIDDKAYSIATIKKALYAAAQPAHVDREALLKVIRDACPEPWITNYGQDDIADALFDNFNITRKS